MSDIADLLNRASVAHDGEKVDLLTSSFEVLFHKEPHLMQEYYRNLIEFAYDKSNVMIKKLIIGFIETSCKQYPQYLPKSKDIIIFLLTQESATVIKRTILCFTNVIRSTLSYILQTNPSEGEEIYKSFNEIKSIILKPQNIDNESTLVTTLKMVEILVLCYSSTRDNPPTAKKLKSDEEFCLDRIPEPHPLFNKNQLQKECNSLLHILLDHISVLNNMTSTNIMTLVTSLSSIAKQRYGFINMVVPILCQCPSSLPKLQTVQNESVKHTLKMTLLSILKLKNQLVSPFVQDLIDALSLVDSKEHGEDAARWYRGEPDKKKRPMEQNNNNELKRVKPDDLSNEYNQGNGMKQQYRQGLQIDPDTQSLILSIISTLPSEFVADLVLEHMNIAPLFYLLQNVSRNQNTENLFQFVNSYQQSPLSISQQQQRRDPRNSPPLASLSPYDQQQHPQQSSYIISPPPLPNHIIVPPPQINQYPSSNIQSPPIIKEEPQQYYEQGKEDIDEEEIIIKQEKKQNKQDQKQQQQDIATFNPKPEFKITTISKQQSYTIMDRALHRMRISEKGALMSGKLMLWSGLLSRLLSTRSTTLNEATATENNSLTNSGELSATNILDVEGLTIGFIMEEFETRRELALQWLQSELLCNLSIDTPFQESQNNRYSNLLIRMVKLIQVKFQESNEKYISNFILEVPLITDGLIQHICKLCTTETKNITLALEILCEMILWRPNIRLKCLQILLDNSINNNESIRSPSIQVLTNQLFTKPSLELNIQSFAINQLIGLLTIKVEGEEVKVKEEKIDQENEKDIVMNDQENIKVKEEKLEEEEEEKIVKKEEKQGEIIIMDKEAIKSKLLLFFSLCTKKPIIIQELLNFYPKSKLEIQQVIDSNIGEIVKAIGQENESLLQVIKLSSTQGSEKLMFIILSELVIPGEKPTEALVQAVKTLFESTSRKEVKYLLPIIHGLGKQEVISLLPMFISQPSQDAASFINAIASPGSPLTPSELLVQLHIIEAPAKSQVEKEVIKAIDVCFSNQLLFKQEQVAVAIKQLLTQHILPPTIMRTMIQSLANYPPLKQFIIDTMRELIGKKIWQDDRLWSGFLMLAIKAKPESMPVILDLPSSQFESVLTGREGKQLRVILSEFISATKDSNTLFSRNNLKILEKYKT